MPDAAATPQQQPDRTFAPPTISLPKGGGAIRGMGEKFAANPVTGTGSMTVPIATSPGRSGFGPQLSLSYDSGAGNGPFGFGWSLSLPAITRKTEKGLPQYRDAEESDVFVLSGAEDLVPVLVEVDGKWKRQDLPARTVDGVDYRIQRYRPRIEGLFARIERWTSIATGEAHWRSISRDNVTTLYGKDNNSRVFDPSDRDPLHPTRIFSWLICQSYDDKGNAIVYEYAEENSDGVDISQTHERNRTDQSRAANRYLKRIKYSNRVSRLVQPDLSAAQWLFEVVFDYDEGHYQDVPLGPGPAEAQHRFARASAVAPSGSQWSVRPDPFSSYRAGFEVRTHRRCHRVLMFHHIPDLATGEQGYEGLVRSTDFTYSSDQDPTSAQSPVYTFLRAVTQSGYRRQDDVYLKRSLPPVEYEYTQPIVQDRVQEVDVASLENLPIGLDGADYQWTDLHGEGIPGILTEQAGAWFYKRNISPISERPVEFAPVELVATKPNLALAGGQAQFMDLAGDGQPDVVVLDGPMSGLYEHDDAEGWQPFRPFTSRLSHDMRDPNLKFVDLDGDGHADVLISEDDAFVWHPSLAEEGFGSAYRVPQALDEEKGPRLVFADSTQSIYLADLSGDGLTDLVRIRNGEVCYWPNLGYGRFGAKVTMDRAPRFDYPDQFDHKRVRLADIDGSGTTDIIYLHRDGVRLYFNQSGNGWSLPQPLHAFPRVDDVVAIMPTDLLGNGTACLVWSSAGPGDTQRQMRFVDLMGGKKPHLLVKTVNNLGAETRVEYSPSTKFYLQDKRDRQLWVTRLPFPVHVVERVETFDRISRNRFVTRYTYHHGYFDGEEREFRGFGMVEQRDTEEFTALAAAGALLETTNFDAASHVPPVLTKTWFHTGAYLRDREISRHLGREYFGAPRDAVAFDVWAKDQLLDDTGFPDIALTVDERREAARAYKGVMLRQEVYALDDTDQAEIPYTVTEQNVTIRRLQPRGGNRHAVFLTHPREAISYDYERNPADPRISHALTFEVDDFGNVLKFATVGYGRRVADPELPLQADRDKQIRTLVTYTENGFTTGINESDAYRTPLPCEASTYELTDYEASGPAGRFRMSDFVKPDPARPTRLAHVVDDEIDYQDSPTGGKQRRAIERVRTLYRSNDLTTLLDLGTLESLALPGEAYKLAFTPKLVTAVYGGRANDAMFLSEGRYVHNGSDANWWIPSGRIFYSEDSGHAPADELTFARQHFFLLHRHRDPFYTDAVSTESFVRYDPYDLLVMETRDPLNNVVTIATKDDAGNPGIRGDYRVLQPYWVTDPNGNRTQVAFDALGMVVGTAVMGKPGEDVGDSLLGFEPDLTQAEIDEFHDAADPHVPGVPRLKDATIRVVYDLNRYVRARRANPADPATWQPAYAATLARERHAKPAPPPGPLKVQITFSHSDGFGREIQRKVQAEPGPAPKRDASGRIIVGQDGQPEMTANDVTPRWVGSGWTVFNNKGKAVRQYEPFFTDTHRFDFEVRIGVSPVVVYDPVERVVATLHPNHTYEKVVFDPWKQATWDVSDTVSPHTPPAPPFDPKGDPDVGQYFLRLPEREYLSTWYDVRTDAAKALQAWPDTDAQGQPLPDNAKCRIAERDAAAKTAVHTATPTVAHFDSLGRTFLTVAHNKFKYSDTPPADPPGQEFHRTRVVLDIEGNQRAIMDERKKPDHTLEQRIVMRYDYDMHGNRIHKFSMEAGARWMLNDVAGKPIRTWDSRGHSSCTQYDPLHRSLRSLVTRADPTKPNQELLTERLVYGEQHPEAELRNLRGKVYLHLDQAGSVTTEAHDFKGNPLRASRRLTNGTQYRQVVDWRPVDGDHAALPIDANALLDPVALATVLAPRLETDTYTSLTTYDALNRQVTLTTPHTTTMQPSIIRPRYNEANLLERVDADLRGATANAQPVWTPFVTNIDYDAKGQRQRIDYGNGVRTTYEYDPLTFRLIHLYTRRGAAFTGDCENPQPPPPTIGAPDVPPPGKSCGLQNLRYTYDPVGNITHIRDDAQQTIYFRNKRVEPSADYTYDAIYRLVEATGREHLGQIGGAPIPHSHNDAPRVGIDWAANDGNAMGTYTERYVYDAVGNFLEMQHRGSDPVHPGWTRSYAYVETSLLEDGTGGALLKTSNRLSSTTVGNNNPPPERFVHDAHGNVIRMPHLGGAHPDPNMHWDYQDQLRQTDLGGGGTAYYVYDAGGQRVRKVWEKPANLIEERIYLGGFEIYRRRQGAARLERETLHIMDDKQRIALVETRTLDTTGNDPAPAQLIRHQFGNHLGSSSLELDDQAQIISYEEYAPYGSTSYQAVRSQTETPKRYRYTAMERDEESGLEYHSARYYLPWLGRWVSSDPIEMQGGINLYVYCKGNPVGLRDRGGNQASALCLAGGPETPWCWVGVGIDVWDVIFGTTVVVGTAVVVHEVTRPKPLELSSEPWTPPVAPPRPAPPETPTRPAPPETPTRPAPPEPIPVPRSPVPPVPKPEPKPTPKPKPEPKPEPKPDPKLDPKPKPDKTVDPIPPQPKDDDPRLDAYVVRAGVATPKQLQAGVAAHKDVPGLTGFSVQSAPGKTIEELAAAGQFYNAQISVTTVRALLSVGVPVVPSPGGGYHSTAVTPLPLSDVQAAAVSAVFKPRPNPAQVRR